MRVSDKNRVNRWISGKRRRRSILGTQRKRGWGKALGGAVWKESRDASQHALPEIVKDPKAGSEDGAPVRLLHELIRDSQPRCHVSVGGLIKRSAARRK